MYNMYKLLRNNQETGPYSLEELLALQPKPFDLVWVEGRSAAWQYPGDIESLKPFVVPTPKPDNPYKPIDTSLMEGRITRETQPSPPAARSVFVSMPMTPRATATSPETPRFTSQPLTNADEQPKMMRESQAVSYSRDKSFEEDPYSYSYESWKASRPTAKPSNKVPVRIAGAAALVLVAAFFAWRASHNAVASTATPEPVAQAIPLTPDSTQKMITADQQTQPAVNGLANAAPSVKENTVPTVTHTKKLARSKESLPIVTSPREVAAAPAIAKETTEAVTKAPEQEPKKKKLGEKVRELFKKKETPAPVAKQQPRVDEEPKPATNRQATKREETADAKSAPKTEAAEQPAEVDLASQVELSSNAPANWMMGVTGLKITLRNRSNVILQTAAVDVRYYNESNELLDKKMVYFSNVPPKGKLTLAAPDHKFADHVDYKLVAVSAKEDRYVRQ